ncbi:phosphate ABC transporter permease PstA [Halopiger xanaduensis]|uniref:Phosphate transport system permease protein PstA n=1 Tax=Halopiger xanaduensis (strain DSM 18323 / JCM 14033 / SH-6) TaxID=797210 RepID=F8D644_HALXS|nr:phosphate ABC transporter permease PstA [Halopiger xanaduensis]AEH38905.1 phosphate ABC transporter, inner membrane subunit PstA [Halopiger xanaduensis SH-6]
MATDQRTHEWYGTDEAVSRLRGQAFKSLCLGATLLALISVFVLLLYVANDAFRPLSADIGWLLIFAATVLLPILGATGYYYTRDTRAGETAAIALGLPVVSLLVAGGVFITFEHIVSVYRWLSILVALALAGAVVYAHSRVRTEASLERLVVLIAVPAAALALVPDIILSLPVLPTEGIALLASFVAPVSLVAGWFVRRQRESDRDGAIAAALTLIAAGAGLGIAPLVGLTPVVWMLLVAVAAVPVGLYVESVVRRGAGTTGLAFPVIVTGGIVAGVLLTDALGFAGPDPWLDWSFLTSSPSRTPEDAGFYPPLVGSVMMLLVIVVSAFPVGVGAAVYLEEYAPENGRWGRLVDLIEVNIGNLAGVPSVVYGILGLALFIRQGGFGSGTALVGGFTVGLLILPIVIISSQEAISAVPDSMRQASYGMGATRWQTVRNVVLPEALPGIMTGNILAMGRAIGETAPLLIIGAPAVVRIAPDSFTSKFSAMPRQIYTWSSEIDPAFQHGVLAAGVMTLLVVLLLMNGAAIIIRNKYQRRD